MQSKFERLLGKIKNDEDFVRVNVDDLSDNGEDQPGRELTANEIKQLSFTMLFNTHITDIHPALYEGWKIQRDLLLPKGSDDTPPEQLYKGEVSGYLKFIWKISYRNRALQRRQWWLEEDKNTNFLDKLGDNFLSPIDFFKEKIGAILGTGIGIIVDVLISPILFIASCVDLYIDHKKCQSQINAYSEDIKLLNETIFSIEID